MSTTRLQHDTGTWADQTFPKSSNESICKHLEEELVEFLDDQSPEEAADIVLLLMHHAHKNGYNLLYEAEKKLLKNKRRTWESEPNKDGYYKHTKEGES